MKKFLVLFLLFLLAASLESAVFPNLLPGRIAPDIFLVLVILFSIRKSFNETWKLFFLAGVVSDIVAFQNIGTSPISFLLVSCGISFLSGRFLTFQTMRIFLVTLFLVFGATILHNALREILYLAARDFSGEGDFVFWRMINGKTLVFKVINNFIITLIFYWPFKKLDRFLAGNRIKLNSR